MKSIPYALASIVALTAACDVRPPTESADLVSASGRLQRESGELEVAVSPQDETGEFVGYGLDESAFSFEDVTIRTPGSAASAVDTQTRVAGISVAQPVQGEALTAVVVFDSSGSMADNDPGKRGRVAAGRALFEEVGEGDQVAVIDFGAATSDGLTASRLLQDFTSDPAALDRSLDSLVDNGSTPLYSSLLDAITLLDEVRDDGGVVIVLTDGVASDTGLTNVVNRAQARGTEIYSVGLGTNLDFSSLTALAEGTGGGTVSASDAEELETTFRGISAGVSVGRVIVRGISEYASLPPGDMFEVSGILVTDDPIGSRIETPFRFLTALSN